MMRARRWGALVLSGLSLAAAARNASVSQHWAHARLPRAVELHANREAASSILKMKPSETAAKDLGDQSQAAASAAMWEPLWPRAHQPHKNAVFGLALNYGTQYFHWFVGSLRRTGFDGDIVLATKPSIPSELSTFLRNEGAIVYPLYVSCKSKLQCVLHHWFTDIKGTLPMAIIRHYLYLSWLQHYSHSSLIMVLDFRDTVFQLNPFPMLEAQLAAGSPTELWLSGEHMPYKRIRNCVFNSGWIRDCYGRARLQEVAQEPVVCSGSITGTREGLEKFERRLLKEVSVRRCHEHYVESDQGYTNLLYHTGELARSGIRVQLDPRGSGPVNTLGALIGKRHGYYNNPKILQYMRDADGFILNCPTEVTDEQRACSPEAKPGSPCLEDLDAYLNFEGCEDHSKSAVVHQWDRHAGTLGKFVGRTLSCRANCSAPSFPLSSSSSSQLGGSGSGSGNGNTGGTFTFRFRGYV
mmetsp:Transcript_12426/g.35939  ORF Transcript_12426/g.35939 Transcript_12426/m.35939 type:complete len:468 (-) Transcript_12426:186-1589(-)